MTARALVVAAVVALGAGYVGGGLGGAAASPEIDDLQRRVDALDVEHPSAPPPTPRHAADEAAAEDDRRLAALADRVAELKKTAAGPTSAERLAADDVRRLQKLDVAKLLEEIEERLGRALMDPAKNPLTKRDAEATLRACDVLLARELPAADRAAGLLCRGRTHMRTDRAAAEAALRESLALYGPASERGHVVAAQLGWTASAHKDPRGASEWFLSIAGQPDAAPRERSMYRLFAANGLVQAGDAARARELYRSVSVEFGTSDDKYARRFADNARDALAKLDKDGGGR